MKDNGIAGSIWKQKSDRCKGSPMVVKVVIDGPMCITVRDENTREVLRYGRCTFFSEFSELA